MNKIVMKKILSPFIKIKYKVKSDGNIYIGCNANIKYPRNLKLGRDINICANSVLICGNELIIGNNSYIGFFSEIMCIHYVQIGNNVICGPYLFITDSNHEYKDINKPICDQGSPASEKNNKIVIEDDCWIGAHVCIIGNVKIGKHSIIAAGAVVNKDVPAYCVAGGYQLGF